MESELIFLIETIKAVPEWVIFGGWDTPRCLWCKGFKWGGLDHVAGHKANCRRQRALRLKEELPLFKQGDLK